MGEGRRVEEPFAGGGEERCGGPLTEVSASGGETEEEVVGLNPEEIFTSMKNCILTSCFSCTVEPR